MRKLTLIGVILLLFVITACSNQDKNEKNDTTNEESSSNYYPFTGEKAEGDTNRKAKAVMVSNSNGARPQTGLSQADIVFEMLAEGNVTRFMAIYQSEEPEIVGPVRSAREYFFTLADNYDALYIYSGAADFINDKIKKRDIEHIEGGLHDNDGHLIVRETFREAPHNMYLQFGAVDEVAEDKGYDITEEYEPLPFLDEDSLPEDLPYEEGSYAKIDYYGDEPVVEYKFDDDTEKYVRYNDGEQTIELESEIPIEIDNVFIVESEHQVIDEERRRDIDIDSGGDAVLLHKGKAIELQWENKDGRIVPVLDGEEISFVPGKTWINFVEKDPISNVQEQVTIGQNES